VTQSRAERLPASQTRSPVCSSSPLHFPQLSSFAPSSYICLHMPRLSICRFFFVRDISSSSGQLHTELYIECLSARNNNLTEIYLPHRGLLMWPSISTSRGPKPEYLLLQARTMSRYTVDIISTGFSEIPTYKIDSMSTHLVAPQKPCARSQGMTDINRAAVRR
jgi:hypothetical protein